MQVSTRASKTRYCKLSWIKRWRSSWPWRKILSTCWSGNLESSSQRIRFAPIFWNKNTGSKSVWHLGQVPSLRGEDPFKAVWSRKSKADFEEECGFSEVSGVCSLHGSAFHGRTSLHCRYTKYEGRAAASLVRGHNGSDDHTSKNLDASNAVQGFRKFILSRRFMVIERNGSDCTLAALA